MPSQLIQGKSGFLSLLKMASTIERGGKVTAVESVVTRNGCRVSKEKLRSVDGVLNQSHSICTSMLPMSHHCFICCPLRFLSSLNYLLTCFTLFNLLVYLFTHLPTYLPTYLLTHSLTYFTYLLTHSMQQSPS